MKIIMFFPGRIDHLPPLMTAAVCMSDLGAHVRIVASGSDDEVINYLKSHNVEVTIIHNGSHPAKYFHRALLRAAIGIKLIYEIKKFNPDIIWYHGPFAMEYGLIPFINGPRIVVAHAHELCDKELFLGMVSRALPRKAHIVIVPEINRLWLLKLTSGANAKFYCIPNRPLDDMLPQDSSESITRREFIKHGGLSSCNRFIIYQGAFMRDRCIHELIIGFRTVKIQDTGLILMGADFKQKITTELIKMAQGDNRIVFMPRIPPPDHLRITKGCLVGVLFYAPVGLNNVYCAPNKIYEYASLGLGIILPDYPGMANVSKEFELGEVCNPMDPMSIKEAIIKILAKDQGQHKCAARNFLKSTRKPTEYFSEVSLTLEKMLREPNL